MQDKQPLKRPISELFVASETMHQSVEMLNDDSRIGLTPNYTTAIEFQKKYKELQWLPLGTGNYNNTYISKIHLTIEGYTGQWVLKCPKTPDNLSNTDRGLKKWLLINPKYPAIKVYDGWIMPYFGNIQASDEQIAEKVIEIYRTTGEVIADACGKNNFLFYNGEVICIDVDLSLRRKSIATESFMSFPTTKDILANYLYKYEKSLGYPKTSNTIKRLLYLIFAIPSFKNHALITQNVIERLGYFQSRAVSLNPKLMDIILKLDTIDPDITIKSKSLTKELLEKINLLTDENSQKSEPITLDKAFIMGLIKQELLKKNIFSIVKDGFLDEVQFVMGANGLADINAVDEDEISLLNTALIHGHAAIASYLIENGALISTPKPGKIHEIHYAAKRGLLDIVKLLVAQNPEIVHLTDMYNQTPFLWAASKGQVNVMIYLLENRANKDTPTLLTQEIQNINLTDNFAPLDWAINNGHAQAASLLTKHGAQRNHLHVKFNDHGIEALIETNNLAGVKTLIQHNKALLDIVTPNGTPLMLALKKARVKIAHYLITSGAKITIPTDLSKHEIHLAAEHGFFSIVEMITNINAESIHTRDKSNNTPLVRAAAKGNTDIVKFLLEKGALPNIPTRLNHKHPKYNKFNRYTALDFAIAYGYITIANLLLQAGAIANHTHDSFNGFSLHSLIDTAQLQSIKILLSNNPNLVFIRNDDGLTPFETARKYNDKEIEQCLLEVHNKISKEKEEATANASKTMKHSTSMQILFPQIPYTGTNASAPSSSLRKSTSLLNEDYEGTLLSHDSPRALKKDTALDSSNEESSCVLS